MYEDALARVDLFSGLRKKELQEVATYLREGTHSPGSVLISQGEKGLGLFILIKGRCASAGKTALMARRKYWGQHKRGMSLARWRSWMIYPALLRSRQ